MNKKSLTLHWDVETTLTSITEEAVMLKVRIPEEGLSFSCHIKDDLTGDNVMEALYRNYRDRVRASLIKEYADTASRETN